MTLRSSLSRVAFDNPSHEDILVVLGESCRLASAYLQHKLKHQKLPLDLFGLSIDDLALDCIADLFERNATGHFILLNDYFGKLDWEDTDDEGLHIALRRLIFSKVNEGLFRRYRESDPSLSKIIRNLKIGVGAHRNLSLVAHQRESWIVMNADGEMPRALPLAPLELLLAHLSSSLHEGDRTPEAIDVLVSFLDYNPHYANGYPLTAFAQALREVHVLLEGTSDEPTTGYRDSDTLIRLQDFMERASNQVKVDKYDSYVGRNKISATTYDCYFLAIDDILESELVRAVPKVSYFEALKQHLPGLTKTEYRQAHRNILEYLMRLTRDRLFSYYQNDRKQLNVYLG